MKKVVIGIIIGALLFGSIGVYATAKYVSKDISYTKKDGTVTNVENALNDLYANKGELLVGDYVGMQVGKHLGSGGPIVAIYNNEDYLHHEVEQPIVVNKAGLYKIKYSATTQGDQSYQSTYTLYVNDEEKETLTISSAAASSAFNEITVELNKDDEISGMTRGGGTYATIFTTQISYLGENSN